MSRERHLLNRIQEQGDKIKELEADYHYEFTKGVLKTKEIEKLNRIIKFIKRGMDGNEQFEQVLKDLEGGHEEKFYCNDGEKFYCNDGENFKFGILERCSTQCESCKIGGKETQEVNRSEESSNLVLFHNHNHTHQIRNYLQIYTSVSFPILWLVQ